MSKKVVTVIAYKFNDIYYATSTEEFMNADERRLIIITNLQLQISPLTHLFDVVAVYKYRYYTFFLIWKFFFIKNDSNILILSNPVLLISQFLIKKINPFEVILLEDGMMNYASFVPSSSPIKKMVQKIFLISEKNVFTKIIKTYLLQPNEGNFFFGEKTQLVPVSIMSSNEDLSFFNHKRIFVGQNIYNYKRISLEDYNSLVNSVIQKYDIEYYIPHLYSSKRELITCKVIDLNKMGVTLEMLASYMVFELYSFGSSVLYTVKYINSNVKSILIESDKIEKWNASDFIKKRCDSIYQF